MFRGVLDTMAKATAKGARAAYGKAKPTIRRAKAGAQLTYHVGRAGAQALPVVMAPQAGPAPQPPSLAPTCDSAVVSTAAPEVAQQYPGTQAHADKQLRDTQKQWAEHQKSRMESGDLKPIVDKTQAVTTSQDAATAREARDARVHSVAEQAIRRGREQGRSRDTRSR